MPVEAPLLVLLLGVTVAPPSQASTPPAGALRAGVVVESVAEGSTGDAAGAAVGDLIHAWSAAGGGEAGRIADVVDWLSLYHEVGQRSTVRLTARRGDEVIALELEPGPWGLTVRPRLDPEGARRYDVAESCALAGVPGDLDHFEDLVLAMDEVTVWWLHRSAMREARADRRWEDLSRLTIGGLAAARRTGRARAEANLRLLLGLAALQRDDVQEAIAWLADAALLYEQHGGEGMSLSTCLRIGGHLRSRAGDMDGGEKDLARACAILGRLAPGTLAHASALNNWGLAALRRGDLDLAEERFREALTMKEASGASVRSRANTLDNLGLVAMQRGDFATAEVAMTRALRLREAEEPDSRSVAYSLNNLGVLAHRRQDLGAAASFHERALHIKRTLVPDSLDVASTLQNLGSVMVRMGDLDRAEAHHREALGIVTGSAHDTPVEASLLEGLAFISLERGRGSAAEQQLREALAIRDRIAPGSRDSARTHWLLARAVEPRSADAAEKHLRRAVEIARAVAPQTRVEAEALGRLARRLAATERLDEAVASYRAALDAMEAQSGRLGGPEEVRSGFVAEQSSYGRELLALLVRLERVEEAFEVLERTRARVFLDVLRERNLLLTLDVDEDVERRRRRITWRYDEVQRELATLSPEQAPEVVQRHLQQLRELRREGALLEREILTASPAVAALRAPVPLGRVDAAALLDESTVLLSFAVGKDASHVFALRSHGALTVREIPAGDAALRRAVADLREVVERSRSGRHLRLVRARAGRLHDLLLGPVMDELGACENVVIVPDGPLHVLPFTALVDPGGRYLVESHAVRVVSSATVLGELLRRGASRERAGTEPSLVAFGAPGAVAGRPALPGARAELDALADLFGDGAELHVGRRATEGAVTSLEPATRFVHFACHAVLDAAFPLNSGLLLAPAEEGGPGAGNGVLQAWEILERLRIAADVAVLSACETGLGAEMAGEGLLGLVRSFQHAGARSVVASLWRVDDRPTRQLMVRFYEGLREGAAPAHALRAAQLELLRGEESGTLASPHHWAAFQVHGGG